ncbi:MAG: glutamate racemase [Gemmatimonadota bacterium]|nr:glutamate racemase [Gemmatimonadota bacterium]
MDRRGGRASAGRARRPRAVRRLGPRAGPHSAHGRRHRPRHRYHAGAPARAPRPARARARVRPVVPHARVLAVRPRPAQGGGAVHRPRGHVPHHAPPGPLRSPPGAQRRPRQRRRLVVESGHRRPRPHRPGLALRRRPRAQPRGPRRGLDRRARRQPPVRRTRRLRRREPLGRARRARGPRRPGRRHRHRRQPPRPVTNPAPIGVFDSGIGGLTVVHELMRQLPHESIVYFGDTARVPYGNKGPETVQRYSREIADFLESRGVKAIVVACNTATAHALPALRAERRVPVIGVVEPGARAAVAAAGSGPIGVIGTAGTSRSGAYDRAIHALSPAAQVVARGCPLFVPLVEEGWTDHAAARLVAGEYLAPIRAARVETLVLGCTHYPLLKPLLHEVLGPGVSLIDSAEETAAETARVLAERGLAAPPDATPTYQYVCSDEPSRFRELGQRFLGRPIDRVESHPLG